MDVKVTRPISLFWITENTRQIKYGQKCGENDLIARGSFAPPTRAQRGEPRVRATLPSSKYPNNLFLKTKNRANLFWYRLAVTCPILRRSPVDPKNVNPNFFDRKPLIFPVSAKEKFGKACKILGGRFRFPCDFNDPDSSRLVAGAFLGVIPNFYLEVREARFGAAVPRGAVPSRLAALDYPSSGRLRRPSSPARGEEARRKRSRGPPGFKIGYSLRPQPPGAPRS